MLVFALYKREAARLEQFLQRNNYDAVAVHGDKGQVQVIAFFFLFRVFAGCLPLFFSFSFFLGGSGGSALEGGGAWRGWQGKGAPTLVCTSLQSKQIQTESRDTQEGKAGDPWSLTDFFVSLSQADRERALGQFKSKERPLMVATDVAARGLDIPDVEFVINYSFPLTIGE